MPERLTILLTNIWLAHYAGSEVVTRDVAVGMLARGHRPVVYSPTLGDVAEEIRAKGVAVIDDLRLLAERPDVIHAHHTIPCAEALMCFPDVPAIRVCHGFETWLDGPLDFPQIAIHVAVDEACRDRLVHTQGLDPSQVVVLQNAVDLRRIPKRPQPIAERPRRALALGKASAVAQLSAACADRDIAFEAAGYHVGRPVPDPMQRLVEADLVFATARAALEALCCGCAVIVCDERGLGGMVTTGNFGAMRARNFGLRTLTTPVTMEGLIEEIGRYDRADAMKVSGLTRADADLESLLDEYEALYDAVLSGDRRPNIAAEAHQQAVARFLHDSLPRRPQDPRWPWMGERDELQARVRDLETQLVNAQEELTALRRSRLLKLGRWVRRYVGTPKFS